jgi:hypothetical protein
MHELLPLLSLLGSGKLGQVTEIEIRELLASGHHRVVDFERELWFRRANTGDKAAIEKLYELSKSQA